MQWSVLRQAYRHWKKSSHEYFFISNNDVLVPDGALTSLMHVMRDGGVLPSVMPVQWPTTLLSPLRGRLALTLMLLFVLTLTADRAIASLGWDSPARRTRHACCQ